ncbi:hypothetical protein AB9F35_37285, partial [Rhizobium leguminosarum]
NGHVESFGFFLGCLLHVFTYSSLTEEFDPSRLSGERKLAATPALPMGTTVRRISTGTGDTASRRRQGWENVWRNCR